MRSPAPITGLLPSVQHVGTPREFISAVEARFGPIGHDLAASHDNAVCPTYYTRVDDALSSSTPWPKKCLNWLNPPFAAVDPWMRRCLQESKLGANILVLVMASVDSHWFCDYVHGQASIYWLSPRIKFIGHKDSFPKPLMLVHYGVHRILATEPWQWKPRKMSPDKEAIQKEIVPERLGYKAERECDDPF